MDDNLLSIRETLLPILMEIPSNQCGGIHPLTGILTEAVRYATKHGGKPFKHPVCLPLYNSGILVNASTVVRVRSKTAHKSRLNNNVSYEAAKQGSAVFLCESVNEVWYNNLKDANTFYTRVMALTIIEFLDANSGGLHAVDMISLCTNMHQYYMQANGITQYIIMLEDAQKKSRRVSMPIANIKLMMMAPEAVFAAQHFLHKVNDWEGLPALACTWPAWKTTFRLAHLKCQCQILASGGGREPLGGAHEVFPVAPLLIGWLEIALDNLSLVATNDTVVLQQLTAANLALTATVRALTATNKKLVDDASWAKGTPLAHQK
jgi:hypothetical protein